MARKIKIPDSDDRAVLYIVVEPKLKEALADIAKAHDRSVTGEVVHALKRYIAECKGKRD